MAELKVTRLGIISMLVLAITCVGCELIGAPKSVTCEKLRQLAVGMTQSEVAAILGPPPRQFPSKPYRGEPPTDPIT